MLDVEAHTAPMKTAKLLFYVYELCDSDGVVFYVGKGKGGRIHQHEAKARRGIKSHLCNKIRKIATAGGTVIKRVVLETDDEGAAFAEEIRRIAQYGRDNLTNQTDGGDGPANPSQEVRDKIAAGRRGVIASEETRAKQRAAKLGTHQSEATKDKIRKAQTGMKHPWSADVIRENRDKFTRDGKKVKWSAEHKRKFIEKRTGHIVTQETRDRISASKKGGIPWNKGKKTTK